MPKELHNLIPCYVHWPSCAFASFSFTVFLFAFSLAFFIALFICIFFFIVIVLFIIFLTLIIKGYFYPAKIT